MSERWKWIRKISQNPTVAVVVGIVIGWVGAFFIQNISQAKLNISCFRSNEFEILDSANKLSIYVVTIKNNGLEDTSYSAALDVSYESKNGNSKKDGKSPVYHQVIGQGIFDEDDHRKRVITTPIFIDEDDDLINENDKRTVGYKLEFLLGKLEGKKEYRFTYVAMNQKEINFSGKLKKVERSELDSDGKYDLEYGKLVENVSFDDCHPLD